MFSDGWNIEKYLFIRFGEIIVIDVFLVISDLLMINYSLCQTIWGGAYSVVVTLRTCYGAI